MKVSSGIRLKQLMLEKGLKQVDVINRSKHLQEELGIKLGKSTLSQYVNDVQSPDQDRNKLEEKKMKRDRLEVSEFFGPKRRQISAAIDEVLWEAKLYSEDYFEKQYNQVDSFRDGLSKETIHDTQAVILYVSGAPNIVDCDGIEAIYTDDDEGPNGGYEQVLRKVQITDLETSDEIHILLTVDI